MIRQGSIQMHYMVLDVLMFRESAFHLEIISRRNRMPFGPTKIKQVSINGIGRKT